MAHHPAAAPQRAHHLGRARLRARHLLAPVHGPDELPGEPPRWHQARAGRQPRQLWPYPSRHPDPTADSRRRPVPGRGQCLEASAAHHGAGLRAAQPGRRGRAHRPGRRGDGGRAQRARHRSRRSPARRAARRPGDRRPLVLLARHGRAWDRPARRLRALRHQDRAPLLPRLPAAGRRRRARSTPPAGGSRATSSACSTG